MKTVITAFIIAAVGVFGVDYFSHLFLSSPMETLPYFWTKAALYFTFSLIFFSFTHRDNKEFKKVLIGGIAVALIWGAYYNILPTLFHYYPFGIALYGLTFLGMGLLGTGLAFGIVHTLAFIVGYYVAKFLTEKF
jgi:hypothetical protein